MAETYSSISTTKNEPVLYGIDSLLRSLLANTEISLIFSPAKKNSGKETSEAGTSKKKRHSDHPIICSDSAGITDFLNKSSARFSKNDKKKHAKLRVPISLFRSGAWGMVTNDAARCARNSEEFSRKALYESGFPLKQLFAPEHGISRYGADGQAIEDESDPVTGLSVCSLYGKRMRPEKELLEPLDGIIFDIPDIGTRFYTYIWTLSHLMEACSDANKPLIILDRMNPVSGSLAISEGPVLDVDTCGSFLGRAPVPLRHSLTTGEFALWLSEKWNLNLQLGIIPLKGWKRERFWPDSNQPFVPTSPAMPSFESTLCYPGTALFEATNLSAGRGTPIPFQHIGARWLKPSQVIRDLTKKSYSGLELPGVRFNPVTFTPKELPCKGERCEGIQWTVTDRKAFRPVRTGLALLTVIRHQFPDDFQWNTYPTVANPSGEGHFERLIGSTDIRPALEASPSSFFKKLPDFLKTGSWQKEVLPFLIYP